MLGRIGGGLMIVLSLLVGAAIAFQSISAADLFGVLIRGSANKAVRPKVEAFGVTPASPLE